LWPTNQTREEILVSYEQEASSKSSPYEQEALTEAQKEMVMRIREMDKKIKGL
jgi:hypothetical protein